MTDMQRKLLENFEILLQDKPILKKIQANSGAVPPELEDQIYHKLVCNVLEDLLAPQQANNIIEFVYDDEAKKVLALLKKGSTEEVLAVFDAESWKVVEEHFDNLI